MSYELHLIRVRPGEDPLTAARDRLDRPVEMELNPGPAVESIEEEKGRLAAGLVRFNPALQVASFDYSRLAEAQEIDEREARRRYRHIELNSDDYSGIQITLFDEQAELIFPYWHSGEQARSVLQQVWDYLEVLQTWGSFVTYDPQLDRMLNLEVDFEPVLVYVDGGSNSTYENAQYDLLEREL